MTATDSVNERGRTFPEFFNTTTAWRADWRATPRWVGARALEARVSARGWV
jgi:hypothetical protein